MTDLITMTPENSGNICREPGALKQTSKSFQKRLTELRVPDEAILEHLTVMPGECCYLGTDPTPATALAPHLLMTHSLDEYKAWIGRPDEACLEENFWELPRAWNGSGVEAADLEKAARAYIFGNSRLVARYHEVLERTLAPFFAAVYALRSVTILPGGSLVVSGAPAVLVFDDLKIHRGGRLVTYTACNAKFSRLEKVTLTGAGPLRT